MIQANVSKDNEKQVILATGSILDFAFDIAVILSGMHTQMKASDPVAAEAFKTAVQRMVADDNGPCWKPNGDQTGLAINIPGDRHDP